MNLREFKDVLKNLDKIEFHLPKGKMVPKHFHITEVGLLTNHFIDCGGTVRKEHKVNFQLWENIDFYHRLAPEKLANILSLAEKTLDIDEDLEIQVEYQSDTIALYNLTFEDGKLHLGNTKTNCLALEACGTEIIQKTKRKLTDLGEKAENCCSPETGCC